MNAATSAPAPSPVSLKRNPWKSAGLTSPGTCTSHSSSSPAAGSVGRAVSSITPSMAAGTYSSGGSYAPGPLMVSSASRSGGAASDGLSAASAPPPHPCFYRGRSVGAVGSGIRPATADQTPVRSRARFASTSSALAHSERRRRTRVRPSLRSHHAASSRSRVVPRGRGALGARGGLRPRGRARPPRRSGWILRLAQVLPWRGEPRRVRGIQGEEARVRRHRTGRHRRAQLQHRRDRCVPRAIPDRSLRSRSPAECVLP